MIMQYVLRFDTQMAFSRGLYSSHHIIYQHYYKYISQCRWGRVPKTFEKENAKSLIGPEYKMKLKALS